MALVISRYSRIEIATSKLKVIRRSIKLKELKFILKGPDQKLGADMLSDKSIGALKNVNVRTRKVK